MLKYSTVVSRLSLLTRQTAAACTVRSLMAAVEVATQSVSKTFTLWDNTHHHNMLLRSVIKPLDSRYSKTQGYELLCWNFLILHFALFQSNRRVMQVTLPCF